MQFKAGCVSLTLYRARFCAPDMRSTEAHCEAVQRLCIAPWMSFRTCFTAFAALASRPRSPSSSRSLRPLGFALRRRRMPLLVVSRSSMRLLAVRMLSRIILFVSGSRRRFCDDATASGPQSLRSARCSGHLAASSASGTCRFPSSPPRPRCCRNRRARSVRRATGEGAQMLMDSVVLFFQRHNAPAVVRCSVLRVVVNGWCTTHRFQQEATACKLGCGIGMASRLGTACSVTPFGASRGAIPALGLRGHSRRRS